MLSDEYSLEEIMAPLATSENTGNVMRDAVISQVAEWLKTEKFPHVPVWPLTDSGQSLHITVGTSESAVSIRHPDESLTLNFKISYEDRETDDGMACVMTGLRGFPPMPIVNYSMNYTRNRSSSYVRPGFYASAPIPEGIKPEQLIQWLTKAPMKARRPKFNPRLAPPAPSFP